jgi:hypothetical protein
MTDAEIMALAEKFAAHRDVREIELRGGAILEFVRAYNEACMRKWLESLPPSKPKPPMGLMDPQTGKITWFPQS